MVMLNYVYTVRIFKIVYNASSSHKSEGWMRIFLHIVHSLFCKGYGNLCHTLWYYLVLCNLGEMVCTEWEIARNCIKYAVPINCFVDFINTNFKISLHYSLISIAMVTVLSSCCYCGMFLHSSIMCWEWASLANKLWAIYSGILGSSISPPHLFWREDMRTG